MPPRRSHLQPPKCPCCPPFQPGGGPARGAPGCFASGSGYLPKQVRKPPATSTSSSLPQEPMGTVSSHCCPDTEEQGLSALSPCTRALPLCFRRRGCKARGLTWFSDESDVSRVWLPLRGALHPLLPSSPTASHRVPGSPALLRCSPWATVPVGPHPHSAGSPFWACHPFFPKSPLSGMF